MTSNPSSRPELQQVAGALLVHPERKVLLHHRDDKPGISNPGKWALFGGHIEPGENSDDTVRRELQEELGLCVSTAQLFAVLHGASTKYFMYLAEVTAEVSDLVLNEGQGLAYFEPEVALAELNLSPSARLILEMFLDYEKFRFEETGSRQVLNE